MELILRPGVTVTREQVEACAVFQDWARRIGTDWPGTVTVTDAGYWQNEIHMLQVTVKGETDPWPLKLILRSETVDVLTILTDGREAHVVFVNQARLAAGARVISNVAGGKNWNETALDAAIREIQEELGLEGVPVTCRFLMEQPVLATPGLTNERVYMMQAIIRVPAGEILKFVARFRGKCTGVEAEGEVIETLTVPADRARQLVMRQPYPDAKTLLSLGLAGL